MRCTVRGADLRMTQTDLPFKVSDTAVVILKNLPVVQCMKCPEYLIEDAVLRRVDEMLARVDGGAELEIIRYAARWSAAHRPAERRTDGGSRAPRKWHRTMPKPRRTRG